MADHELNELLQKWREVSLDKETSNDLNLFKSAGINSMDDMINKARDESVEKRIKLIICWCLGRSTHSKATEALLTCAQDNEADIKAEAIKSLGVQGKTEAVPLLINLMMHDNNMEVRKSAAYALGLIGDPRAFDMLVFKMLDQNEVPEVRGMAAEALGDLGDQYAMAPLIRTLSDDSNEVKFWAANSLGRLGKAEAIPALKNLINELKRNDTDLSIKKEAEDAISKIEDKNK
jgi:HEAT repeat protein